MAAPPDPPPPEPKAKLIGYARVSTDDQNLDLQRDALTAAGVHPLDIYEDKTSGAVKRRIGLDAAFRDLRSGDVLVVWKLDRLGRTVSGLIDFVNEIRLRGANIRVLTGFQVDTTTAAGTYIFHLAAALAEFERGLILERTAAGLAVARKRGRYGGRVPVLTAENEVAIRTMLLGGTSVVTIAAETGVSKSVIYLHRRRLMAPDWQPMEERATDETDS
jgi:DNA invertase Pin-like site-specific DNA recombinase